jgi:hypothetical protein
LSVFESIFEITQDLKVSINEKNNLAGILKRYYPSTKLEAAGQKINLCKVSEKKLN